jgi:hypothetical protein
MAGCQPGFKAGEQIVEWADIWFEVVYVLRDFHLLDAESYQRTYSRHDGKPLNKGFYFVCWPPGSDASHFGTETVFHGPFMRRRDAITNMYRLRGLLKANDQKSFHMSLAREMSRGINPNRTEHWLY